MTSNTFTRAFMTYDGMYVTSELVTKNFLQIKTQSGIVYYNTALSSAKATHGGTVISREADIVTAHGRISSFKVRMRGKSRKNLSCLKS